MVHSYWFCKRLCFSTSCIFLSYASFNCLRSWSTFLNSSAFCSNRFSNLAFTSSTRLFYFYSLSSATLLAILSLICSGVSCISTISCLYWASSLAKSCAKRCLNELCSTSLMPDWLVIAVWVRPVFVWLDYLFQSFCPCSATWRIQNDGTIASTLSASSLICPIGLVFGRWAARHGCLGLKA